MKPEGAGRPRRRRLDGLSDDKVKLIGETGAVTGFDTPDEKDSHATRYTTTPESSRVGSSDQMLGAPPEVPDPASVTAPFDHLATRDPKEMEHALQRPEYEGAESNAPLGVDPGALAAVPPAGDLDLTNGPLIAMERRERAIDPNPGYTPPSEKTRPHVPEPGPLDPDER